MAIRWDDIQNLNVTEDEINLLAGLNATAAELNEIAGFTGNSADLNALIGLDGDLAAHEALDFTTAHPIAANSLDGLLIADNTIIQSKLAFDVATQVELGDLQTQVDNAVSDIAVQQSQIDNLFSIVIPGQGDDLADAIQQTIDHIELVADAHDSSAISYGNYYTLPSDITAGVTTSLVLPASIIKHFRVGESIRFQDDITATEDVVLTEVNYTTNTITFAAPVNGYTTADNGIIWTLSEDNAQEALDRSFRNDGETSLVLREGIYSGTISLETLTSDRNYTVRDVDTILGNPDLTGNALSVLRVNAGETDVEWHDLTLADIDFDNSISGLTATDSQAALDELDGIVDAHIADATIHFTEASISHLNIQDIGVNSHDQIDTHIADASIHFIINDAATAIDEAWSSQKIQDELDLKSDGTHNHTLDSLTNVDSTGKVTSSILEWNGTDTWIVGTKGEINTGSSLGAGEAIFAGKIGQDLQFKSLIAGTNISFSSDANTVTINATDTGEANTASNVGAGSQVFKQKSLEDLQFRTLVAGANVTLTQNADTIEIASSGGGGGGAGGTSIQRTQTAHGFSVLDAIYHDGTEWVLAQANNEDTLAEYVVTEVTDVNNFTAFKFGEATVTGHGLTVGEHYYLSDSVAGGAQITEPLNFSSPLFYVEDANTIHVEVYRPSEVTELVSDEIKYQKKVLSSNLNGTTIDIADLRFSNLEIGKTYKVTLQAQMQVDGSESDVQIFGQFGGTGSTVTKVRNNTGSGTDFILTASSVDIVTATATTLIYDYIVNSGSNPILSQDETYVIVEELPVHTATTDWT